MRITYSESTIEEAEEIAQVYNTSFAKQSAEDIGQKITNSYLVVAKERNRIVGAASARIIDKHQNLFPAKKEHLAEKYKLAKPIGLLESSVVIDHYKKQGIGTDLTKLRMEWLKTKPINQIVSFAWCYPNKYIPADYQLINCGLNQLDILDEFWSEDPHPCFICGDKCSCQAALYVFTK